MCVRVRDNNKPSKMSTKQAIKREANTKQKKSETVPKKPKIPPVQNNNVDDVDFGKIHADDHQVPLVDETAKSRAKLPDEVLKNLYNEPGRLLIAGNVAWNAGGTNKVLKRNELYFFHRFIDKKVSKNDCKTKTFCFCNFNYK